MNELIQMITDGKVLQQIQSNELRKVAIDQAKVLASINLT